MIVAPVEPGWKIYFHKAHALLAMDIGLAIDHRYWPVRKYLAAGLGSIGEHDNAQPNWNGRDNLTEAGAPLDYRDRKEVNLKQASAVVRSAQYKSSFMAIMVSLHCQNLYRDSADKDVIEFLDKQRRLRNRYEVHLNLDSKAVLQSYEFLRFCDDLSLALCQDEISRRDEIPIEPIIGDEKISLKAEKEGSFTLRPWIFFEDELVFPVEFFRTTKRFFGSDEELKQDIALDKPLVREFVFRKSE
ncbi:DUF3891 family protein [Algoriphagus terrigena]|uniref:DUF3891 family protein n=1 Tax=Algoriphagus terrigena TaxID=344884 RepID=UPI00041BC0CE|nr:DUF3891 family protein [Algoriphagus terrigena]